ncbi:hypothetical protein D3C84_1091990 [compost metagenome]
MDIAGLTDQPVRRNTSVFQRLETQRMYFAFRLTARAVGFHACRCQVIEDRFTKDAAAAIGSAEEQDFHRAIS